MKTSKSNFFNDVYEVVKLIPEGRVTSYGAIAEYLGTKGSARMVGWAMHGAVATHDVPAHRVVNRQGLLTGKIHFGGDRMQRLLEKEGIRVEDDIIQNFEKVFWEPIKELGL